MSENLKKYSSSLIIVSVGFIMLVIGIILLNKHTGLFLHDDSFFYLKIAHNLSQGLGSTFDGINSTNGYHYLYALVLSLISKVFPLTGTEGPITLFIFDTIYLVISLFLMDGLLKRFDVRTSLRLFTIVSTTGFLVFNDLGMEVKLLLPIVWTYLYLLVSLDLSKVSIQILISITGALVFFTRIDYLLFVFITSAVFVGAAYFTKPNATFRQIFYCWGILLSASVMALIAYLLFNQYEFGYPTSVSSWIKNRGIYDNGSWLGSYYIFEDIRLFMSCCLTSFMRILLISGTAFIFLGYIIWKIQKSSLKKIFASKVLVTLIAINLFSLVYMFITFTFSSEAFKSWYLALPLSFVFVTIAVLAETFLQNYKASLINKIVPICLLLGAIIVTGLFINTKIANYDPSPHPVKDGISMGIWMKNDLSKNARIFQVDRSGATGYFSELSVVNGDGLVNGWEYVNAIRSNNLIEYLSKYDITYFLWDKYNYEEKITIPLPNFDVESKRQELGFIEEPKIIKRFGRIILLKTNIENLQIVKSKSQWES